MSIELPPDYHPSPNEDYMNSRQVEYFRRKLRQMRVDLLREFRDDPPADQDRSTMEGDEADMAEVEIDRERIQVSREHALLLLNQVDQALSRIADGSYGYCDETGEPIGLKRLEAQPTATLSLEAQERAEARQRSEAGPG